MSEWNDWLRELRAAGKGPVDLPAATRGLAWEHPVEIEGDWTGAALEGSVSIAPANSADELVSFTVTGPVVADGWSTFMLSLTSGQVSGLPSDGDLNGETKLPYMIRLTPSGGAKDTLIGGLFTVLGVA